MNMSDKRGKRKEPEMLSAAEAAREMGVLPSAISQAVKRGRLVSMRFKHLTLISREALQAYIKSRSKGGRPRKNPH